MKHEAYKHIELTPKFRDENVFQINTNLTRLWKEVEKLETDNIFMLTDMYDERMMDIKRSRSVLCSCTLLL